MVLEPVHPGNTRTRTTRQIAADPTSTALLLTGPAALELWPGVRRVGEAGGRALVETDLPSSRRTAATVRALPPRRTPTAFVTRFQWSGPELPGTSGELRLSYVCSGDASATLAELELTVEPADTEVDAEVLRAQADGFLENLGRAAEARSDAA
ncbi:MAG: hypothetical protein JWM64_402 [Frankiales bacterium]|nr:hypothetical protein [Frankiales bacterium]